jgi:hypothetical protein
MSEYAPAAITAMFNTIKAGIPSAQMAGIIGDSAHTYGYHRGRNYVSGSDYSVSQNPADRKGDGEAACALDISWGKAADQYTVSQRLLNAKNNATAKKVLRSFFGSTDGYTVCGWDYYEGCPATSDDSHLWHVHLSITRQYSNDHAALQQVAAIVTGGAAPSPEEDDMPKQIYLYSKSGQTTKLAKANTYYTVGWDASLSGTGGSSMSLPDSATIFSMAAWLYTTGLAPDDNLYWRVQTLDRNGNELAKFPVGEVRGTSGGTNVEFAQVGSVPKKTNLRLLVAATCANVAVTQAWWRCLYW